MTPTEPRTALIQTLPLVGRENSTVVASQGSPEMTMREIERKIFRTAQDRFQRITSYENKWRQGAREELNFAAGKHWSEDQMRERQGRPCLVFDRISPSIDQVVNDLRQAPPEPHFIAVGNGADKETAEILQGLLRNIERDSRADIAYETGYQHGVQIGRGWWRIAFEYENNTDFSQKIVIKRVANPFSVYPDPAADEFDYSDMRYCFVTEDLDKDVFDELYPNSPIAAMSSTFEGVADKIRQDWFPNGAVRVAEYWWVETSFVKIYQLENGSIVFDPPGDVRVINERMVENRKVRCVKLCGNGFLYETDDPEENPIQEWAGKFIPLIPVVGREIIVEGKRSLRGMVRPAMDGNLMFDYISSKLAEGYGLASLSQWMVAEGSIEGLEQRWADSNRKAYTTMPYRHKDAQGEVIPPPQRITPQIDVAGLTQTLAVYDNNTKATLSTYDASLGARGPEESGRAIIARQREADNAHFDFHDNMSRSIQHTGRVILDLVPHIYTEERLITIYDPDGRDRQVLINKEHIEQGAARIYKIGEGIGRFDVAVKSGPGYATRREEAVAGITTLVQMLPGPMSRTLDLLIKMMDIPMGEQIADRVRPPDVKDEDNENPQQTAAQLQQAMQLVQQLTQLLNQAQSKEHLDQMKYASAERIAGLEAQTELAVADAKLGHDKLMSLFEAYLLERQAKLDKEQAVAEAKAQPAVPQSGKSE